jgi:hypothetical protein
MSDDSKVSAAPEKGSGASWKAKFGGSLAILVVGLVASAISGLYLEISIGTPSSIAELTSFADLKRLISGNLDFGTTQKWRGYIGETEGSMHHIEELSLTLKQLSKFKRAVGDSRSADTGDEYSIVGFFGGSASVLVDVGRTMGFGAYILKPGASQQIPGPIYFGYALLNVWRDKPGGETFVDKCPIRSHRR